jgi:cell division protein FtsQ
MQQGVPPLGRALPGMPLEMADPDGDEVSRPNKLRSNWGSSDLDTPASPWWRPQSNVGRVFLGFCALIVLGSLAVGIFLFKTYIERDARFRIAGAGDIEAAGLTEVSRAEMLPVFGEDIGRNIFFVPLEERRKQLEALPWVEHATVMRLLPDQIRVAVIERQPVAFVRHDQQIGLVDASGVLLSMPAAAMAQHHYSFPVVTGIDPRDPLASRRSRMAVYQRLMAELDADSQHLSEQISEIDLTDPEDARVLMPEQGEDILAHFGEDHFLERYQRYKAHIGEWRQQYPKLAAVDLRYDQQVVLEISAGAGSAQAAVGTPAGPVASDAKPSPGVPAEKGLTASAAQGKQASGAKAPHDSGGVDTRANTLAYQARTTAAGEKANATAKPADHDAGKAKASTTKDKTAKAKDKAALDKKRRADAKRTLANLSKKKASTTTHSSAVEAD